MTDTIFKAYNLGKRLAFLKFSEDKSELDKKVEKTEVETLTDKLESIFDNVRTNPVNTDIIDSSERSSTPTWGDKIELETNSNTGINV